MTARSDRTGKTKHTAGSAFRYPTPATCAAPALSTAMESMRMTLGAARRARHPLNPEFGEGEKPRPIFDLKDFHKWRPCLKPPSRSSPMNRI